VTFNTINNDSSSISTTMKRTIINLILLCVTAATALAQGQTFPVELEALGNGVNSRDNDYAPFVARSHDTLYFTSSRGGRSSGKADIFTTSRLDNGWAPAMNAGDVNTEKNDGALSIAADGRTVVFASDASDGEGDADLYIGEIAGGTVVNVRNLGPTVNTPGWESQPAISGDGSTVYFASNRPGGTGRSDLWMTRRDAAGEWSIPVNLGPAINTGRDELSPFVTLDGGTLFFSSNGRGGSGEHDVFMSATIGGGAFSEPLNLGTTVNSPADDLFFSAPASSERFYLASTRDGGAGGLDIYAGAPNVFGGGMFRMRISVTDSTTGERLGGEIAVVVEEPDGSFATVASTYDADGEHVIYLPAGRRYQVTAKAKGFLMTSETVDGSQANVERRVDLRCGGIVLASYDMGEYNVPFFVTGYYRPNTTAHLEELARMMTGELSEATYVERFAPGSARYRQYAGYARTVEAIFANVAGVETRRHFAAMAVDGTSDIIEITVTGYADPQDFSGRYVEPDMIAFHDTTGTLRTLHRGQTIGNLELSGLRAWHSGQHLDALLAGAGDTGASAYAQLRAQGRVRYRFVAAGVRNDGDQYELQRRINVTIVRKGGAPSTPGVVGLVK
jgi:hypothetical protein